MAEEKVKNSETKKPKEAETAKNKAEVKESKSQTQTIVIAVLATALVCVVLTIVILALTGVIRFGNSDAGLPPGNDMGQNRPTEIEGTTQNGKTESGEPVSAGTTKGGVTCYDKTRVQVYDLEFCLPEDFEEGDKAKDGAYTYNLVDDDGWAEVHVYFMKTSRTPTQFINYLSSSLKVTDQNYTVNGTTWVRAEAGDYMQAFATKSDDYLYGVFYSIKLDSDETSEAWQMIPKTLVLVK